MTGIDWERVSPDNPPLNVVVVCTDGSARWLDMRMGAPIQMMDLLWNGRRATHFYLIPQHLPAVPHPVPQSQRS